MKDMGSRSGIRWFAPAYHGHAQRKLVGFLLLLACALTLLPTPPAHAQSGGQALNARINFQPAGTAPAGYEADTGQAYDGARGFGWVSPARPRQWT